MSDTPETSKSQYKHHDATPGGAPDRSAHAAVPDSFPASDPVATTAAVGSRAVDPAEMMEPEGGVEIRGGAAVVARELYDHRIDPEEDRNVAGEPANREVIEGLAKRLAAGWGENAPPMSPEGPR